MRRAPERIGLVGPVYATRRVGSRSPGWVGIGLHSINEIEEEVRSLHNEMMQFGDDLARQLFTAEGRSFEVPLPGVSPEKLELYRRVWRPLMNEWLVFQDAHGSSFWQNLPLSGAWDKLQDFRGRLIRTREQAQKYNFHLMTIAPSAPRPDLDLGDTAKKVAMFAGIAGVAVLGTVIIARSISSRDRSAGT